VVETVEVLDRELTNLRQTGTVRVEFLADSVEVFGRVGLNGGRSSAERGSDLVEHGWSLVM